MFGLPVHELKQGKESQLMKFAKYSYGDPLKKSHHGINVPEKIEEIIPNIVLTPLFVFNPNTLHRVGYGGGYYDRTINYYRANHKDTIFIGLAIESLKSLDLKNSPYDEELDFVITENHVYTKM